MPPPLLCRFLLLLLPGLLLCSCSTTNHLLKARPVKLSPFFEQRSKALHTKGQLPFQKVWTSSDANVRQVGNAAQEIYIAPVTLAHLRPPKKAVARQEIRWGLHRQEKWMAWKLREEFAAAMKNSPRPRYRLVKHPGRGVLTLKLAITELNPTSPNGNAALTLMKVAVTPAAGLARWFTTGNMAIEGKVTAGDGSNVFFQFADNEADKLTFFNARDFLPYGHAEHSMRDWAEQFEQMTRREVGLVLKDSSAVTLRLH
jgi:hypothetical protein